MRKLSPGQAKAPKLLYQSEEGSKSRGGMFESMHGTRIAIKKDVSACQEGLGATRLVVRSGSDCRKESERHLLFNLLIWERRGRSTVTDLQVSRGLQLLGCVQCSGAHGDGTQGRPGPLSEWWGGSGCFLLLQLQIWGKGGKAGERRAWMRGGSRALFDRPRL